ncbi:MAG TPA: hypothetical protein VF407_08710 [Polyangiaceae bacterium]
MNPKNPFFVLELPPAATPGEIERAGRKLLALLDVGSAAASTYECAFGSFPRDATLIREAMATLRDPKTRAKEALLASLIAPPNGVVDPDLDAPLPEAFALAGFPGL